MFIQTGLESLQNYLCTLCVCVQACVHLCTCHRMHVEVTGHSLKEQGLVLFEAGSPSSCCYVMCSRLCGPWLLSSWLHPVFSWGMLGLQTCSTDICTSKYKLCVWAPGFELGSSPQLLVRLLVWIVFTYISVLLNWCNLGTRLAVVVGFFFLNI